MCDETGLASVLQLAMDGPWVTKKVLKLLVEKQQQLENMEPINILTCGLHIISGALKLGFQSMKDWELHRLVI